MSDQQFERAVVDWLEDGSDRTPRRAIDGVLLAIKTTTQERDLRIPGRFLQMPALSRATSIAAVALVAVVGASGLMYLASNRPGGVGSQGTAAPTPTPTTAATTEPSLAPTPRPSEVAKGIYGWKTYTSAVYDYTVSYPDDWVIADAATQKWKPGESEETPSSDLFTTPEGTPENEGMAYFALQFPAPTGADLRTWNGLLGALTEMCAKPAEFVYNTCPREDLVTQLCLGTDCQPVALVMEDGFPRAIFGDTDTGIFTYIQMGRRDDFPAAAKYGGTVMLLKSILSQLGVRELGPGETPN
jgi:hypothetical protein